uniref:Uncharacterized protein n=1 Tax=Ditylenchus dipsaci TaxID=166011 RepID=A0A915E726_9BILA
MLNVYYRRKKRLRRSGYAATELYICFFDNDLSSRLIAKDLAIIQLAEEVPANSNIGFACLACDPKSNLAIEMTVLGLDTLSILNNLLMTPILVEDLKVVL